MGQVTFVHCTPQAEQLIAQMARVSNPANQDNHETAPRLLRYLIKHRHWSPFEMASLCVKIETERDIAAQILRHRSFSFQEFSTRYAETRMAEIPEVRRQDTKNRQNSIDDLSTEVSSHLSHQMAEVLSSSYRVYQHMLHSGVAKETARRILPLCTPTVMYMHGTLRSWIHYIDLRTEAGTQLEHRDIAYQCQDIFEQHFPSIHQAAFSTNG
ncbi:MAG: FAD-dependent thymidylate synthase [Limnohabitans sp.]